MIKDKKITVFTPTYNRAYILDKCYKSLCEQTNKEFIWLIVDDGSTDGTKALVEEWKAEDKIKIVYVYQENQGKQRAVNTGVLNCKTELFIEVDSDDYFTNQTIEKVLSIWEKIKNNKEIGGIMGRRATPDKELVGSKTLPNTPMIDYYGSIVKKYKYYGDTCRTYRTEVLKEALYPEINDKFIPEDVMFFKIDKKYKLYIVNEVLTISEYLGDGYTKNYKRLLLKNPQGYSLLLKATMMSRMPIKSKFKAGLGYIIWCWRNKIPKAFVDCPNKIMYIILTPIAVVMYVIKQPRWYFKE